MHDPAEEFARRLIATGSSFTIGGKPEETWLAHEDPGTGLVRVYRLTPVRGQKPTIARRRWTFWREHLEALVQAEKGARGLTVEMVLRLRGVEKEGG